MTSNERAKVDKKLTEIIQHTPVFGEVGMKLVFHGAKLIRIEVSRSDKINEDAKGGVI